MKKSMKAIGVLCLAVMGMVSVSYLSSCSKDEVGTTGGGGKEEVKDYLLFDGVRVEFNNPTKGYLSTVNDTALIWSGNQPSGPEGDTTLTIMHITRKAMSFNVDSDGVEDDDVFINIRWGDLDGKPRLTLNGGDYTLKREDGFWVSTLKNGTGTFVKNSGDEVKYTGIEFRATWPD